MFEYKLVRVAGVVQEKQETAFNTMAADGWMLVSVDGGFGYFARPLHMHGPECEHELIANPVNTVGGD